MGSARMLTAPRRYHLTVEEYERMIDADVFPPDARIELLEGVLYEIPPMGLPHQRALQLLIQNIRRYGSPATTARADANRLAGR